MNTDFIQALGLTKQNEGTLIGRMAVNGNHFIDSISPVDGKTIGQVSISSPLSYEKVVNEAEKASRLWSRWPAPQRGEVIRQYGLMLRDHKSELGKLVSYEMGKSYQEGLGEVQEMIDICDFATGLSRQLYGRTMHSERHDHRMYEQWHPLGIVGIISAFNFPVAVWSWNAMIAMVCGNVCIWKPSEKTPLCAIACQNLLMQVFEQNEVPGAVSSVINGDYTVGELMTSDRRVPLISATGSCAMGRKVGQTVAGRLGKTLLELGGNNAIIVTPNANMDLVLRGAVFGAVGTSGQRCTSTRRLIIHDSIYEDLKEKLVRSYGQIKIGNPLEEQYHMGPLIDKQAVESYVRALDSAREQGANILVEGEILEGAGYESGCYVSPSIVEATNDLPIVQQETFGPILYLLKYRILDEAINIQNGVDQGLSSAIMTNNLLEAEQFLSSAGSDCGIANVNIGTSGAEIGGAFGGEKDTGGGRESGSDAWKAYMRRQTNTINYGSGIPLAQGINFDL